MTWQTIDTAPKDGSWIDLWEAPDILEPQGQRHTDCYWGKPEFNFDNDIQEDDWCSSHEGMDGNSDYLGVTVTHWMPLPAPPTEE